MVYPIPSRRPILLGLLVALLSLCTGCATPVLYNESRDKQGQDAKAAAASVDLPASFDQLRTKFQSLAALEAQTLKTRSATSRDLVFKELAMPPNPFNMKSTVQDRYVARLLNQRLDELGGDGAAPQAVDELERQAASKLRVLSAKLNASVDSCDAAKGEKKSGTQLSKLPPAQRPMVAVLLNDAVAFCQKLGTATTQTSTSGEIADLRRDLKQEQEQVARRRGLLKDKRDLLEQAAVKADQDSQGKSNTERLQAAAGKLKALLDGIRDATALSDASALKAAEASVRFDAIDQVLKALSDGTADLGALDANERRAVLVVRFIPSLADEIDSWMSERKRVRMAPLLLAKENQRLIVAGYEAEVQVLQKRAQIRARILASAEAEQLALVRAKTAVGADTAMQSAPLSSMLEGSGPDRFRLFTSFTQFDEAEEHRLAAELARLELDASASDLAIVTSQSAAAQWSHLSTSIAAVLADFHAQGIKPGDLAEFLKAIGVIGIAAK